MKFLLMFILLIGCGTDKEEKEEVAATQCVTFWETKTGEQCGNCSLDCMQITVCSELPKIDDGIQYESNNLRN